MPMELMHVVGKCLPTPSDRGGIGLAVLALTHKRGCILTARPWPLTRGHPHQHCLHSTIPPSYWPSQQALCTHRDRQRKERGRRNEDHRCELVYLGVCLCVCVRRWTDSRGDKEQRRTDRNNNRWSSAKWTAVSHFNRFSLTKCFCSFTVNDKTKTLNNYSI